MEPVEKRNVGEFVGTAVFTITTSVASNVAYDLVKPKIQAAIRRFQEKDQTSELRGPDDLLPKR